MSYGNNGAVSITCAVTQTIPATPDNTAADPVNLGTLGCGQSRTMQGLNVGNSNAWYSITFTDALCPGGLSVTLSGNSGDVFDVKTSASSPDRATGVTQFNETSGGTYLIRVYGGNKIFFQLHFSL